MSEVAVRGWNTFCSSCACVHKASAGLENVGDRCTDAAEHGRPVGGLHAPVSAPLTLHSHSAHRPPGPGPRQRPAFISYVLFVNVIGGTRLPPPGSRG